MIKKLYTLAFAAFAFVATASADDNLTFNWAHSVDAGTNAGDNCISVVKASDGALYAATVFGTTTKLINVAFDGENITDKKGNAIEGSPYTSSFNNNLLIQKLDNESGAVKWFAYTDKGYVDYAASNIAATSDGGVVFAVKTKAMNQSLGYDNLLEIVDGTGAITTIKDNDTQSGEYRYVLGRLDSEGRLKWTTLVYGLLKEVKSGNKTNKTQDNMTIYGLTVDENDNVYLAGNFRTEISFRKSNGRFETFTANNVTDWNGSDTTVGDLFVAKFEGTNGYYTSSLMADGTAKMAYFDNMAYADGTLYLNGRVISDGTTMKLGDKEVTADQTLQTMIIAAINTTDLSVKYVNGVASVANTKKAFVLQNKNLQVIDGCLYLTGSVNGGFAKLGETTAFLDNTKDAKLKGYVLKVNAETGDVESSYVRSNNVISNYFGVYVAEGNTYACGYDNTQTVGAILTQIGNDSFSNIAETSLCKNYGTVANCGKPAIDGSNFVMMCRGKGTPTFYGGSPSLSTTTWGTMYYSYKIDDTATNINGITVNENNTYDVYTVDGVRLKRAATSEEAVSGLQKGLYIIGGKKVVIK